MNTRILELLRHVRFELEHASAGNPPTLARPRARLAWIATLIPPECEAQRRLLDSAARVTGGIGLGQSNGASDIVRLHAAREAVRAVMDILAHPQSSKARHGMEEAGRTLAVEC